MAVLIRKHSTFSRDYTLGQRRRHAPLDKNAFDDSRPLGRDATAVILATSEFAAAETRLFSCPHASVLELTVIGANAISAQEHHTMCTAYLVAVY